MRETNYFFVIFIYMSYQKLKPRIYGIAEDVNSDSDDEDKNIIELSEITQQPPGKIGTEEYKLLTQSVERATSPDELMFRSDKYLNEMENSEYMKKMRDGRRRTTYEMWSDLIEKGRKIDESVIEKLQNYIILNCYSDNLENVDRCNKYRDLLNAYWNKNPDLVKTQKRIGGKRRLSRKSIKKSKKRRRKGKITRRNKKYKR